MNNNRMTKYECSEKIGDSKLLSYTPPIYPKMLSYHAYKKHGTTYDNVLRMYEQANKKCVYQCTQGRYLIITPIGNYCITPDGYVVTAYSADQFTTEMKRFVRSLGIQITKMQ